MDLYRSDVCGNMFLIVRTNNVGNAKRYLRTLQKRNEWDFDSALIVAPSDTASCRMEVCEPDGSVSSMCGNGARVVGTLLRSLGMAASIEVGNGRVLYVERSFSGEEQLVMGQVKEVSGVAVAQNTVPVYKAAGEPHAVVLVENVYSCGVEVWGRSIVLAHNINCTVVSVLGNNRIYARTFERGVNRITASCGTGASSAVQYCRDQDLVGNTHSIFVSMHNFVLTVHNSSERTILQGSTDIYKI